MGRNTVAKELRADDFARLLDTCKSWGPVSRGNFVNRVRVVFKWATDSGLIDAIPRYGPDFARPSKKEMRLAKARKGPRMFEAEEIRRMLDAAKEPLRTIILLAINCGFGNAACGRLPMASLDLGRGWVNYHREKTGIARRCPLWVETVASLQQWLRLRPRPKDAALADRVFITASGGTWHKEIADSPVTKEMSNC